MKQNTKSNIGKKELIKDIQSVVGTSSKNIQKIIDDLIDIIIAILNENNKLNIKNIGSFRLISKKKREGRNPRTKEKYFITSRRSVSFKISSLLKKKINEIK